MHVVRLHVCVHTYETLHLDFPSELLKTASGELDMFLRKGRRQGAITLLAVRYFPFPPQLPLLLLLLLLTHVAHLLRSRRKCLRQMSAATCLKPSTWAAELGKL